MNHRIGSRVLRQTENEPPELLARTYKARGSPDGRATGDRRGGDAV